MNPYVLLGLGSLCELVGTTSLEASEGFTRLWPSVLVVVGYGLAFYLLSHSLKFISLGVVYAIWSGVGTALVVVIGVLLFRESLDLPRIVGIALIVIGVIVLHSFPKATA